MYVGVSKENLQCLSVA